MRSPAPTAPAHQEAAFLDYVERVGKLSAGRQAVHLHLSKLGPQNRQAHRLHIAALSFQPLLRAFEGALFRLRNDDIVVVCKGASGDDIARSVIQVENLFADDPLVKGGGSDPSPFYDRYDLETNYPALLALARQALEAGRRASAESEEARSLPGPKPIRQLLDPKNLSAIETAIAQADLTGMIRRQAVCALVPGQAPQPVFFEVFTSINALQELLLPDVDIHGNRWLFQDLTTHLDYRVISYLARNDDATLKRAFSLNLNVGSLVSPEFLKFDQALSGAVRRSIVIELQPIDVLSDLDSFIFARNFLQGRNYRFCLDALTHQSLPVIDCKRLGVDLVKIVWSPELHEHVTGRDSGALRERVEAIGPERIILIRCDSALALETGRALGSALYQGFFIDTLLNRRAGGPRAARAAG